MKNIGKAITKGLSLTTITGALAVAPMTLSAGTANADHIRGIGASDRIHGLKRTTSCAERLGMIGWSVDPVTMC